jgi:uncharacterized membrane protein YkvI
VYRDEADGEDFPRLCMRCGEPADCDVKQTFAWMPSWVNVCILLGLLPWLVVMSLTRKTMRVVVPMCERHAGHWRVRRLYVGLGLLFWLAVLVGLCAVGDELPEDILFPLIGVSLLGALVWLVVGVILSNRAIKASEIRDRRMDLVNVHRHFADVWNDMDE